LLFIIGIIKEKEFNFSNKKTEYPFNIIVYDSV
jgi:hypothetical protein